MHNTNHSTQMTNIASKEKAVMLIDDNDIDNFINEKIVKNSNFTKNVYVHTSALSALEFLKDIEIIEKDKVLDIVPSYIFLDINMPIADGFYFLEEYKKISDKIKSRIKIIVLTTSP